MGIIDKVKSWFSKPKETSSDTSNKQSKSPSKYFTTPGSTPSPTNYFAPKPDYSTGTSEGGGASIGGGSSGGGSSSSGGQSVYIPETGEAYEVSPTGEKTVITPAKADTSKISSGGVSQGGQSIVDPLTGMAYEVDAQGNNKPIASLTSQKEVSSFFRGVTSKENSYLFQKDKVLPPPSEIPGGVINIGRSGVEYNGVTYTGNAVVPNTGGKTANQLQRELSDSYFEQTGERVSSTMLTGSIDLGKGWTAPKSSSSYVDPLTGRAYEVDAQGNRKEIIKETSTGGKSYTLSELSNIDFSKEDSQDKFNNFIQSFVEFSRNPTGSETITATPQYDPLTRALLVGSGMPVDTAFEQKQKEIVNRNKIVNYNEAVTLTNNLAKNYLDGIIDYETYERNYKAITENPSFIKLGKEVDDFMKQGTYKDFVVNLYKDKPGLQKIAYGGVALTDAIVRYSPAGLVLSGTGMVVEGGRTASIGLGSGISSGFDKNNIVNIGLGVGEAAIGGVVAGIGAGLPGITRPLSNTFSKVGETSLGKLGLIAGGGALTYGVGKSAYNKALEDTGDSGLAIAAATGELAGLAISIASYSTLKKKIKEESGDLFTRNKRGSQQVTTQESGSEYTAIYDNQGRFVKYVKTSELAMSRDQALNIFKSSSRSQQTEILKNSLKNKVYIGKPAKDTLNNMVNFMKDAGLTDVQIKDRLANLNLRQEMDIYIQSYKGGKISYPEFVNKLKLYKEANQRLIDKTQSLLVNQQPLAIQSYGLNPSMVGQSNIQLATIATDTSSLISPLISSTKLAGALASRQVSKKGVSTITISKLDRPTMVKEKNKILYNQKYDSNLIFDSKVSLGSLSISKTKTDTVTKMDTSLLPKLETSTETRTVATPLFEGGATPNIGTLNPVNPFPEPKKPVGGISLKLPDKRLQTLKEQPYDAYAKFGKTYKKINKQPLNKLSALSRVARVVDQTLSRRGKIEPAAKVAIKGKKVEAKAFDTKDNYYLQSAGKFRPFRIQKGQKRSLPPGTLIEKKTYALDSPGEVANIQKARRQAARRSVFGF